MFFCNKNKILMFVLLISLSFFIKINVFALEDITVADGDYELICVYSDGAKVTIARDEIYLTKNVNTYCIQKTKQSINITYMSRFLLVC